MKKFYCNNEINCIGLMLEAMMLGNHFQPAIVQMDNGDEVTLIPECNCENPQTMDDIENFRVENANIPMGGNFEKIVLQLYSYEKFLTEPESKERVMVA